MRILSAASFLAVGLLAFACSDDSSSDDNTPTGTGGGGGSGMVPTPGAGGPSMPPTGGGTGPGPAAGGGGGTGGSAPMPPMGEEFVEETGVDFAQGLFSFSDMMTTIGVTSPEPGKVCMNGSWVASSVWGAGMGVQLKTGCPDACTAFDAEAAGITGVKFTLSGVPASGVRFGANLLSAEEDGFIPGGAPAGDFTADGEQTVMFADLGQPVWVENKIDWDGTNLSAVQFQVNLETMGSYEVCASNIAFLDAAGAVVEPPDMPAGGAGAGGGAAGGAGGAAGGAGGAAGGAGGAAGGAGGSGGA